MLYEGKYAILTSYLFKVARGLAFASSLSKALEQQECGHTPFLIATGLNMVITSIKLKY